jgi:uncharacterized protein YutE (UPF0331/DUF86 family)
MNLKKDDVEGSTSTEMEKNLEMVATMESARKPLKTATQKAIKIFSKNLPDFFSHVCVKHIYQPSFAKSAFDIVNALARIPQELKSLFALVELRNIQVRFDSMMWRIHVLKLYTNMENMKMTLVS